MPYFNACRSAETVRPMCVAVVFLQHCRHTIDDKEHHYLPAVRQILFQIEIEGAPSA